MHLKVQNGTKCLRRDITPTILLNGDIVYVVFPGQMVVNQNT